MSATPRSSRAAVFFIFITVVLDMLALGAVLPVLPKLVVEFTGGDMPRAAQIYGLFGTVWALMHFIFSPIFGALSDKFGRRPIILLSVLGMGLDYILMALAPNLTWLFIGRILSGITASNISAAGAYIADVTPPEKRAAGFGIIGAAFGIGFVLGPAFGGLFGHFDPRLPFWIAAGLSLLNAVYGLFVLPESLPPEKRTSFEWKKANPIGSIHLLRSHPGLFKLALVNFLSYVAHAVLPSVYVLYVSHRYQWSEKDVGLTLALVGVCSIIVQSSLVGWFVRRFGEYRTLYISLTLGAIGFLLYGWAPTGWLFILGIPFTAIWGLNGPATQALMTQCISPTDQGKLQGAISSLRGISELIGPGLFTMTFAYFISPHKGWDIPGASFYLAGAILGLCLLLIPKTK